MDGASRTGAWETVLNPETHRTGRPVMMNGRRLAGHSIAAARHKPGPEDKGLANGRDIPQAHHYSRTVKHGACDAGPALQILNHKGGGKTARIFQQEETP
jgi:hypothetical protein